MKRIYQIPFIVFFSFLTIPFAQAKGSLSCRFEGKSYSDCLYKCENYGLQPCNLVDGLERCPTSLQAVGNKKMPSGQWLLAFNAETPRMSCFEISRRPYAKGGKGSSWTGLYDQQNYRTYQECVTNPWNTVGGCIEAR